VGKIRQLSEYKKFQETLEIDDLKAQATEGPIIVVNISNIRADAIILTPRDVKAVPLHRNLLEAPRFSANTSTFTPNAKKRKALGARDGPGENMYSWLWTSCVKPVLNELKEMGYLDTIRDQCPRVWWIGCGMATSLPFHAAGVDFGPDSFENTLSQVISSYTPTVKALAQSRLRASTYGTGDAKKKSVLLVTMPTTVGLWDLPAVEKEKDAIQRACGDAYDVEELRLPTAESVLKGLEKSDMAHFACHASSDPTNPYDSHLKLQRVVDGGATLDRLTMLAVSKLEAEGRPLVAFLSACSTVQIRAGQFADEGLHLAGAFQVAGFAHVIGALWSAHDDMCAWIAEEFYGEIIRRKQAGATQRVVADALHQAILRARSGDPSRWAPFIHIGI
jgi:CHAT domain